MNDHSTDEVETRTYDGGRDPLDEDKSSEFLDSFFDVSSCTSLSRNFGLVEDLVE